MGVALSMGSYRCRREGKAVILSITLVIVFCSFVIQGFINAKAPHFIFA